MRHRFETMGTVVSLDTGDAELMEAARLEVEEVFRRYQGRYSLYDDQSELSAVAAGRELLVDASEDLREVYADALSWRTATGGAFTPHRPDGVIDLSGIVKALAIRDAGAVLDAAGIPDWTLNAGGDVLARTPDARPARIAGIADPDRAGRLLTSLVVPRRRRAVATSGTSERGEHVWRRPGEEPFAQVTVLADDIVTADVLATAILAGGQDTCDLVTRTFDCDVLAIDARGDIVATPGIRIAS